MKFLFNDGSGKIVEASSEEELISLINNTVAKEQIRIWKFNTSTWIGYQEFLRTYKKPIQTIPFTPAVEETVAPSTSPKKITGFLTTLKIVLVSIAILGGISVLAYVLLSKEWLEAHPEKIYADRLQMQKD